MYTEDEMPSVTAREDDKIQKTDWMSGSCCKENLFEILLIFTPVL